MKINTRRTATIAGVVGALALTGVAIASATSGGEDGNDTPITGSALQRASAAALAHTRGGRVTGTEIGDEESRYEVEVTKADGSQVDVQLDAGFRVVGAEADLEDDR